MNNTLSGNRPNFNPTQYNFNQTNYDNILGFIENGITFKNKKYFALTQKQQDYLLFLLNSTVNQKKSKEVFHNIVSVQNLVNEEECIQSTIIGQKIKNVKQQLTNLFEDSYATRYMDSINGVTDTRWSVNDYYRLEFMKGNIALTTIDRVPTKVEKLMKSAYCVNAYNEFALQPGEKLSNVVFDTNELGEKITSHIKQISIIKNDIYRDIDNFVRYVEQSGVMGIPDISERRNFLIIAILGEIQYKKNERVQKKFETFFNKLRDTIYTDPTEILATRNLRLHVHRILGDIIAGEESSNKSASTLRYEIKGLEKSLGKEGVDMLFILLEGYSKMHTYRKSLEGHYGDNVYYHLEKDDTGKKKLVKEVIDKKPVTDESKGGSDKNTITKTNTQKETQPAEDETDMEVEYQKNPLRFLSHDKLKGSIKYRTPMVKKIVDLQTAESNFINFLSQPETIARINNSK